MAWPSRNAVSRIQAPFPGVKVSLGRSPCLIDVPGGNFGNLVVEIQSKSSGSTDAWHT
jgi:hypothetical protein